MSDITATIEWNRNSDDFLDNRYSRVHHWTFDGGTTVIASSSPHIVRVPMSDPSAVDPEEAFIASLSSCHMLWFLSIAARKGWRINHYKDKAIGQMGKNSAGKTVMLSVFLRPCIVWDSSAPTTTEISEMHEAAHQECFIANSVLTDVQIEPQQ